MGGTITFRDLEDDISAMLFVGKGKFKARFEYAVNPNPGSELLHRQIDRQHRQSISKFHLMTRR
jgi:hypothetical protein